MIPTASFRRTTLLCLLLGAVTLAVYWPVVHYGFINYDDPKYVVENPRVASGLTWPNVGWAFQAGHASNWHPLTWLSHMLDVQLFGLNPTGHHLTSLLFHLANTLLLFVVLRRMTGAVWRSAFVAALFALHPLHVESVAWVAERKDVLSTFFFMLTLWAYGHYAEVGRQKTEDRGQKAENRGQRTEDRGRRQKQGTEDRRQQHATPVLHSPASRVKLHISRLTLLPSFPLLLRPRPDEQAHAGDAALRPAAPRLLATPPLSTLSQHPIHQSTHPSIHQSINPPLRLLLEKLPFFVLTFASCIVTFLAQGKGAAMAPVEGFPVEDRVANALVSYFKYTAKTIWPSDLAVFYPLPSMQHPGDDQWPAWLVLAAVFSLAAITALVLRALRRQPWLAMGWLWFLGTLVPVIGLVQVGSQAIADRYSYIPLIGLFIALVWSAAELLPASEASPRPQSGGPGHGRRSGPRRLRCSHPETGKLLAGRFCLVRAHPRRHH